MDAAGGSRPVVGHAPMAPAVKTIGVDGIDQAAGAPSPPYARYGDGVTEMRRADVEYGADLVSALIALIKQINAFRNRLAPAGDFDISQTLLLIRLAEDGPARAVELAERICADPSTVSRQVAAMVRSGLIERRADPQDGRASVLALTTAGRERIAWHRRMRGSAVGPLIADWPVADRSAFLRLLTSLTSRLDQHRDAMVDAVEAGRPAARHAQEDLR